MKQKEVDECYKEFVRVWTESYPMLGFDAVSGKKIKELIKQTKWRMQLTGKETTIEKTTAAFAYVIAYVKRVNHFIHLKPITIFASQYLSIIAEIEAGKNGQRITKKPNARDVINSFRQGS